MKNLKNWHVLPIPDLGQNFSDFNFSFFLFTLYYFYFIQEFSISHWNDRSILSQRYPFFPLKHTSRIITISLFIFTNILHHQFLQNVFPKNHNFVNLPWLFLVHFAISFKLFYFPSAFDSPPGDRNPERKMHAVSGFSWTIFGFESVSRILPMIDHRLHPILGFTVLFLGRFPSCRRSC